MGKRTNKLFFTLPNGPQNAIDLANIAAEWGIAIGNRNLVLFSLKANYTGNKKYADATLAADIDTHYKQRYGRSSRPHW